MKRMNGLKELARINYQYMHTLTDEKVEMMHRHMVFVEHGYKAYAITVTFLPHLKSAKGHTPEAIKRMMINLYLHQLVRDYLFDGHGNWAEKFSEWQPFAHFYMEEHEHGATHRPYLDNKVLKQYQFAERLHYHGIMFVDPMHVEKMDKLLGEDTLIQFHRGVMSSKIEPVFDIGWTGYQMKFQHKYSDRGLNFGHKLTK